MTRDSIDTSAWDSKRNNFDPLRLSLALLVLISHSFPLASGNEDAEPIRRLTHGQLTGGAIAVDLFFVMSGFLITASMLRSSGPWSFLRKRVARIYPGFIACALLSFVVFSRIGNASLISSAFARTADLLLQTFRLREFTYTSAFPHNPYPNAINGSLWSVQYEFWCYIGVLLLGFAGLLYRRVVLLGAFVCSVVVSLLFILRGWIFGGKLLGIVFGFPNFWARLLPFYLAGVIFYLYRSGIPRRLSLALACVASIGIAAGTSTALTVVFPIAGTYLVLYLAFAPWLRLHRAGRFGDFSYGLYLYAFPVEQIVAQRLGDAVTPLRICLIATPITLTFAVVSWYAVEKHFLSKARSHDAPTSPARPSARASA